MPIESEYSWLSAKAILVVFKKKIKIIRLGRALKVINFKSSNKYNLILKSRRWAIRSNVKRETALI